MKYIKHFIYLFLGYFLISPLSFVFPKSNRIWIFGSGSGGFVDNAKYFYIWCCANKKNIKPIWIAKNKKDAELIRKQGYAAYYEKSFGGFFYRLRAKVFIFSSYLTDCGFFYAQRTIDVNLWHGVGIKKIERQIKSGAISKLYEDNFLNRLTRPHLFKKPTVFLTTSDHMASHFKEAFNISDEALCFSSYPRLNFDFYNEFSSKEFICFEKYNNVILYAPTFRDDKLNLNPIFNMTSEESNLLNNRLSRENNILIIKSHPNEKINSINLLNLSNIVLWDNKYDIYEYKEQIDCLITDYSSIFYDFLYIDDVDLIMFPFDYNDYLKDCRDMSDDYFSNVSNRIISNKKEFFELVFNYSKSPYRNEKLFNKFWGKSFGKENSEIYDFIIKKIKP